MTGTTIIQVQLPAIATTNLTPAFSASAINLYMKVDTTPTSITYNTSGNTSGFAPTYNIISLSNDPTFTSNFISDVSGINGLFDLEHMCFVPSYQYGTGPIYPSVEFYVNIAINSSSPAFNNNMYNYVFTLNAPSTNSNPHFFLYGTPGDPKKNYFIQVSSNKQVSITLSYYSPPAPTVTMGATMGATLTQTTEQTASMVSKQIKYQYGNKANVKATGPAVTVTSIYGLTEKDFPVTISLPVTQLLPTFTFSEITTKDVYGNEQALDDGLPLATAGFNASMRKRANLAYALALRDDKIAYWFKLPPVSEIDKYTALIEGEETANKAKSVKGYRLDFSNPYSNLNFD
jgi:hypothetical protein